MSLSVTSGTSSRKHFVLSAHVRASLRRERWNRWMLQRPLEGFVYSWEESQSRPPRALDEMFASFRPDSEDVLSYLFKDTFSNRHLTLTATLTHTSFNFLSGAVSSSLKLIDKTESSTFICGRILDILNLKVSSEVWIRNEY